MDTIADEHYYRSNEYLLENADRYNYYYRAYKEDGTLDEAETSKVFVGEYASTDTTYRWTPDCIWFDDETVWYTPNYYVQHLYSKYLGSTGDSPLVHMPNVNKKNDELVTPSEAELVINKNTATVTLAANSVNVIVLDLI